MGLSPAWFLRGVPLSGRRGPRMLERSSAGSDRRLFEPRAACPRPRPGAFGRCSRQYRLDGRLLVRQCRLAHHAGPAPTRRGHTVTPAAALPRQQDPLISVGDDIRWPAALDATNGLIGHIDRVGIPARAYPQQPDVANIEIYAVDNIQVLVWQVGLAVAGNDQVAKPVLHVLIAQVDQHAESLRNRGRPPRPSRCPSPRPW